ncbi:LysR family transcriptional regulator [Gloeocapsopsis dulcis]|uniref:LysR family transcriptional regulator n=1 Tax=Gloeocapsopsis dulcis AAB1 = 1H9 TaxID=1433147 RepID=A0A6N8FQE7_9CHRO|nr:LysR family transcriptional regulator [Gloeocapsopsis dulcis]MUL35423.1 LysR family transcriptional regulator [Gloeocapsopsis dulcis AAB1 = 1H9]WNN90378.1 LysR family transcriptional regulator [Gloeocapsopsis dulcis]
MSDITSKIKLSQLRALVAVAEQGNFSTAALHLEISQSAVSHAIAALEEDLGVVLLARGRYGAHPTPVGERIIAHARQVLQLLETMAKEANLEKGLHGGQVRIACFRSVATHILPAVIAQFRSNFPKIAITITEHYDYINVEQDLREGHADLGFTYLPASDEFETWELLRDDYIVLLPPTAPNITQEINWQQLAAYPLIVPSTNTCSIRIRNHLKFSDCPLNVAYEVREDSTIVSMVAQGLGAAILPRLAAEPVPRGLQACTLPTPLERVIGVAVLADTLQTPAVFAFLDVLKKSEQFILKAVV